MQQAALNVLCKIGLIIVVVILELVETRFHRFVGIRIPHTGFKLVRCLEHQCHGHASRRARPPYLCWDGMGMVGMGIGMGWGWDLGSGMGWGRAG